MQQIIRCVCYLICAATLAGPPCAQQPLADSLSRFIGGGQTVAWFEKGGTIWRTDGTVEGTRDTGVIPGTYSYPNDLLMVYRPTSIDLVHADGSTTRITPPIAFDGIEDDASLPTVWRVLVSSESDHLIEMWTWNGAHWSRSLHGVRPPLFASGRVSSVRVRAGRYLVQWDDSALPATAVTDLFSFETWLLTDDGTLHGEPLTWSSGLIYPGYWQQSDSNKVVAIPDRGSAFELSFWVWGRQLASYDVFEPTLSFPALRNQNGRLFPLRPFGFGGADFALPAGEVNAFLWTAPGGDLLAHATQGSVGSVLWYDVTAQVWSPASGFGSPAALNFIGNHESRTYLAASSTHDTMLMVYDESAHHASAIASGLTSISSGVHPFANDFVFSAEDSIHGNELWISDGTTAGTHMIADLSAGATSSNPTNMTRLGERLLFTTDSATGRRLWSLEPQHLEWVRCPENGRFYKRIPAASWQNALATARNWGADLTTIRSAAEQAWIWSTFGPANLWTGLADPHHTGVFSWSSGEPLGFTSWCPNEPSGGAMESAVHLTHQPGTCSGGWSDDDPAARHDGIVERRDAPGPVEHFGAGCGWGSWVASAEWVGGWPRPSGSIDLEFTLGILCPPLAAVFLGVDSNTVGGLPLPIELSSIGSPGCYLHIRPDDAIGVTEFQWAFPLTLRIPNLPALRGATLFVQAIGFELTVYGGRTTNALRITIGI